MTAAMGSVVDQARLGRFRGLLGVQGLAGLVFGVIPLLVPGTFASITGYTGSDEIVYRLAGAATAGYLVAALVALALGSSWADLRIPIVATLTFTAAAAIGSLVTIVGGDTHWVVFVVLAAAAVFAVIAAYWLIRDEGSPADAGSVIDQPYRVIIGLATASAAVFGILPLLSPSFFATLFGLAGSDAWIFRMAGAACLGYATAGVLELRAPGYRPIAVQNIAAIAFNAFGAISSWYAILNGNGGLLAPAVAIAATFFAFALSWMAFRLG